MGVPFGFSVGDFIGAIELTAKISKALSESGGASTDCRLALQDLRHLSHILETLTVLRYTGGANTSHINAVRTMASTCLVPLKEFAEKLDRRYGSTLGEGMSSANVFKRGGKRVQWALFSADEVMKFRTVIAAKVVSISILLVACHSESMSTMHDKMDETRDSLRAEVVEVRQLLDDKLARLAEESSQKHNALSASISRSHQELTNETSKLDRHQNRQFDNLASKLDQQCEAMRSLDDRLNRTSRDVNAHYSRLVGICCGVRIANEQTLSTAHLQSRHLNTRLRAISQEQREGRTETSSNFRSLLTQSTMLHAIGNTILRLLIPFSEKVLDYLKQNMAKNMEIFAILVKLRASVPKAITAGAVDCIIFEDVLSRTQHLPFVYFRHWEVFESMLLCEFKGFPGEQKVLQGNYILVNAMLGGSEIDRQAWEQMVFPQTRVKMSVIVGLEGASQKTTSCPRCEHTDVPRSPSKTIFLVCPACSLTFVMPPPPILRIMPGLPKNSAPKQTRAAPTTLESYLVKIPERQIRQLRVKTRRTLPLNSMKPVKETDMDSNDMTVFRMVHVHDTAGFGSKDVHPGGATTDMDDAYLEDYLRAVLVGDSDFVLNTRAYHKAYSIVWQKMNFKGINEYDEYDEKCLAFHRDICNMITIHVEELALNVREIAQTSRNSITLDMGQILTQMIWPLFYERIELISRIAKRLESYMKRVKDVNGLQKPPLIQYGTLEMVKLLDDLERGLWKQIVNFDSIPAWNRLHDAGRRYLKDIYSLDEKFHLLSEELSEFLKEGHKAKR